MVNQTLPAHRDLLAGRRVVSNLNYVLQAYGDGKLFGESYGEGPPRVVWLHGWARTKDDFRACATLLASEGVASVALDLPGFGASPAPDVPGGARHYAELIEGTLAQWGDEPIVLVGHSFGGRVATVVAAQHPGHLRAVVLTGVPLLRSGLGSTSPWRYRAIRWLHGRGLVSEQRMERARQRFGSSDYRNASGIIRDVLVISVNESYDEELASIRVPVWMLWGRRDSAAPVAMATRAASMLTCPHSFEVLDVVGHMVPTDAPEALVASVMKALE
jgi:pimeloyl-ACP methyl ester carboxylesterase